MHGIVHCGEGKDKDGTDYALFDRSEKPLDDLAMICSAAVEEVREGERGARERMCRPRYQEPR